MTFGLLSAVLAAFFLWRQRDIKRLFGYSSIEHMGIITFAFGLGGPVANFAALLHMTVHSLTKSSIFFTAGHASQTAGTQQMDGIRGLVGISPTIGWGLMLGSLAILGMPPFGVFASEFLILTTAMREHPWTTPFLFIALGVAFAGNFQPGPADGFRRERCTSIAALSGTGARVRSSRHGADAWAIYAAGAGRMVSRRGAVDRVMRMSNSISSNRRRTQLPSNIPSAGYVKVGAASMARGRRECSARWRARCS